MTEKPTEAKKNKQKIKEIQNFIKDVLEEDNATLTSTDKAQLRIAFNKDEDVPVDLSRLSSGGRQLLIISALVLGLSQRSTILIDEPELHLHPTLQRKLLVFLNSLQLGHRIVLATHSSVLLDAQIDKAIIAFEKSLKGNEIQTVVTTTRRSLQKAVEDIGCRPSDILLANGVIWVEGPSDRLYIKRWLELVDEKITEGQDYSFQFYGGSLLGRLSIDFPDEEVDATKLSILTLNPNYFFVMDSDQSKKYKVEDLAKRQQNILKYLGRENQPAWITEGYTIENYLPDRILKVQKYENPQTVLKTSKVSFAEKANKELTKSDLNKYDLNAQIVALVEEIKRWNV
jgi:hypothetical protein